MSTEVKYLKGFPTAAEARQTVTMVNTEKTQFQLGEIHNSIHEACKNGEFNCRFWDTLHPAVEKILKDKGYTVSTGFDRNETVVTISWRELQISEPENSKL